ncbi:hypothetical protein KY317_04300 [Candidatus Woesearchaeota archaeon]|nr:hypothetical protein [Candidatus Woesearchaeota archaeon]
MKDISKRIVSILLVVYLIAILTQVFFILNNPVSITGEASSGQISITILSTAPSFSLIPNQTLDEGDSFTYYVNATDINDINLTFSDDATFFDLTVYNGTSSIINFTATAAMAGTHVVNISVQDDSNEMYSQNVVFIITAAAPPAAPAPGGGGAAPPALCSPGWVCSTWGECTTAGIQYRECIDRRNCNTLTGKPPESRICLYIPTCFDGILNGHETDTDCGGQFCRPCEDGRICELERDCVNECNETSKRCYSVSLLPPITVEPKPVSLWQRLRESLSSVIKFLMSRWIFTMLAILILIISAYLFMMINTKKKLKLIYRRGDQSLWRCGGYSLKVFKILNRKKLRINLEIVKKTRHIYKPVTLTSFFSRTAYSLNSIIRGLNPFAVALMLYNLKRPLRKGLSPSAVTQMLSDLKRRLKKRI